MWYVKVDEYRNMQNGYFDKFINGNLEYLYSAFPNNVLSTVPDICFEMITKILIKVLFVFS